MSAQRITTLTVLLASLLMGAGQAAVAAPASPAATVVRDEYGVPHVYATTTRALLYGDGYAQAQDRLWQADLVRRTATGTLGALVGAGDGQQNVLTDRFFRLYTGGTTGLRARLATLDAGSRAAVQAFVDGVNAEVRDATRSGTLPVEYAAVHGSPAPWQATDVVAIGMLSINSVGVTGADELQNARVLTDQVTRLGPVRGAQAFADSHWLDDPSAPTTIPGPAPTTSATATTARAATALPDLAGGDLLAATSDTVRLQSAAGAAMRRLGLGGPGHSNAVLLSGALSRTGHPLLLGGPQIGHSLPQGFVEIGLHGAGIDATGVVLAGAPGVQIGVGHGHAWTVTSGGDDNADLYTDRVDPVGHPGQYLFRGRWQAYACRPETIAVAGASPVRFTACEGVHGPVLGSGGSTAIALRDATRDRVAATLRGFLDLDRATTAAAFLGAARTLGGSLNIWYADARHIAYQRSGPVPLRAPGDDPFLPHPGDGSDEWTGFLPVADLPAVVDPPQGWLANWNNKPRAGWANSSDGFWQWGPVQRVQTLQRQVAALAPGSAGVDTLERVNRVAGTTSQSPVGTEDVLTVQAVLAPLLAQVATDRDPRLAAAADRLRSWGQRQLDANGDARYDNPAVAIYQAWYSALVDDHVATVLGLDFRVGGVDDSTSANVLARLLQGPSAALPLTADYLDGGSLRSLVTGSLVTALDRLTTQYGTADPGRWHPPVATLAYPPLGAGTTLLTPFKDRGTYNQVVSLLPGGPEGENVVAPGQSGDVRSPHFTDQLDLYATWRYKPMRLTRADLVGHTSSTLLLHVPA